MVRIKQRERDFFLQEKDSAHQELHETERDSAMFKFNTFVNLVCRSYDTIGETSQRCLQILLHSLLYIINKGQGVLSNMQQS